MNINVQDGKSGNMETIVANNDSEKQDISMDGAQIAVIKIVNLQLMHILIYAIGDVIKIEEKDDGKAGHVIYTCRQVTTVGENRRTIKRWCN